MPPPEPTVSVLAAWRFALGLFGNDRDSLLVGAVLALLPLVGPIAFNGWEGEVLHRLHRRESEPRTRLQFDRFMTYFEQGMPSFLVTLGWSFAIGLVLLIPAGLCGGLLYTALSGEDGPNVGLLVMAALAALAALSFASLGNSLMNIARVRADLAEDSAAGWRLGDIVGELRLTQAATMRAWFGFNILAVASVFAGLLLCFVGIYAVLPVVQVAAMHLRWQLHQLYLARGGTPVPAKPAAPVAPPPMPGWQPPWPPQQ